MKEYFVIVLIAAALGGIAAFGLLELLQGPEKITFGDVRVEVGHDLVRRNDVLLLLFASGFVAAVIACAAGAMFGQKPKRRRR